MMTMVHKVVQSQCELVDKNIEHIHQQSPGQNAIRRSTKKSTYEAKGLWKSLKKTETQLGMCNISDAYSVCIEYQNILFNCLAFRCSLSFLAMGSRQSYFLPAAFSSSCLSLGQVQQSPVLELIQCCLGRALLQGAHQKFATCQRMPEDDPGRIIR